MPRIVILCSGSRGDTQPYVALGAGLGTFLEAGSAPLYVGFGSMPSADPGATTGLIVEALTLAGERGVLYGGWGGMAERDLPDSMIYVGSIPHEWLFTEVAAVVHHGGAGTTAAALRAGTPSIVIPLMGDQPFWGRRARDLGVGPKPIPRKKLTAPALAAAIEAVLEDSAMRARSRDLRAILRAEDGVSNAAALISDYYYKRIVRGTPRIS